MSSLIHRAPILLGLACVTAYAAEPPTGYAIAPGKFKPTYESFKRYKYPKWFRDYKLGIWAHWGPQSVPMAGDWYARNMYIQGSGQYQDHLDNYGHPTVKGYKDIIPLWKAEKWDPDRLMGLYKKAGAKYFVSMACHHDNFDLWNSKYHTWNAVNMGPKRDVVGDWQKAAKKLGLKFGISEHMGASFTWFQFSHGSDKTGPYAGVPYDGANPRYEELYHQPAKPGDNSWYSNDPRWHQEWFNRVKDVVDQYKPDLVYTDGGIPFDQVGRSLVAHLYNTNPQAVYTCKQGSEGMWVEDLERGVMPGIRPYPWQTDTSIGDWFYNKNWKYRGADWVIQMLVDIVSKNGNLLINVVQRPDGSLDPEAEKVLADMAAWIKINGEAIYGTRPWLVHGEGPVRARGGAFGEDFAYSGKDIRFTSKGNTLYASILGWPADRKVLIRSLIKGPGVTGTITDVQLLGYKGKLTWSHTSEGLAVELPSTKPCDYVVTLKIRGRELRSFNPSLATPVAKPLVADASGSFLLGAEAAVLTGSQLRVQGSGEAANIGYWDVASESASWTLEVKQAGKYRAVASCAALSFPTTFVLEIAGAKLTGSVPVTGDWEKFVDVELGEINLSAGAKVSVSVKPMSVKSWKPMNLRWVKLVKV